MVSSIAGVLVLAVTNLGMYCTTPNLIARCLQPPLTAEQVLGELRRWSLIRITTRNDYGENKYVVANRKDDRSQERRAEG
jgi:hypothetical protein